MQPIPKTELSGRILWRRQCARHLMDCYALGMEVLRGYWGGGAGDQKPFEALTQRAMDGIWAREEEGGDLDGAYFNEMARLCRACAGASRRREGGAETMASFFGIYEALFDAIGDDGEGMDRPDDAFSAMAGQEAVRGNQ